ncbi:MAG: hypothetical protein IPN67_10410 [Bacteroidales bacterium]|nr:hypothetical protein [Bacteroidales bacterium]
MKQRVLNIGIIEPSDLLFEGLTNIFLKHNSNLKLYRIDDLEDLNRCIPNITFHVIVLNTILIQNRAKLFRNFKREYSEIRWIGIMNSLISTETLNEFNEIVRIDESSEDISRKIISIPGNKAGIILAFRKKFYLNGKQKFLSFFPRDFQIKKSLTV